MRFVILVVVMIIAVVAGFATLKLTGQAPQRVNREAATPDNVETVDVLVAKTPIPVGTEINESMIDKQPWPRHLVLQGFITSGSANANLTGMVARSDVQAREPFLLSKLANPNDSSFLAAGLPKGMRAITVPVTAITGVAGYLFPGDRVDVVMTHDIPVVLSGSREARQKFGGYPVISEVVVSNIKVLAVNQRAPKQQGKDVNNAPSSRGITSVTVEVSAEDAQRLRLAERTGKLSLALRSLKDGQEMAVTNPSTIADISRMSANGSESAGGVRIIRGAGASDDVGGMPSSAGAFSSDAEMTDDMSDPSPGVSTGTVISTEAN